jgi:hypothetical protein
MPEVIRTILTADSSELRSEFAKASAALSGYQQQQQAGFSKALAGHQSELAALRLESTGFTALASSMREQNALRDAAARLAASANITEKQAVAILQEKLQLQKNLVTSAAQASAAAVAAASRLNAITNPRSTGLPGGGGLAPLTPQSLAALDRGIASTNELRRQTLLAGQAGKNGALGFLAFSQAVEDAQYGIKGVLNNIPQMILGFGGTAGLAGAISLAAVAATLLYPVLKDLYGATDNQNLVKAAKEFDAVFKAGMETVREFERGVQVEREMLTLSQEIHNSLKARLQLTGQLSNYWDEELTKAKQVRDQQKEILQARFRLAEAKGEIVPAAKAGIRDLEGKGTAADLVNRQKEYLRVQQEILRIGEVTSNLTEETQAKDLADTNRLIELKKNLAGSEANIAAAKKEMEGLKVKDFVDKGKDLSASSKRRRLIKEEIEAIDKGKEVRKSAYAEEIAAASAQIKNLDTKANKTKEEIDTLTILINQRRELNSLEDQTERATAAAAALKKQKEEMKELAAQTKRAAEENKRRLAEQKRQNGAQADFGTELAALRLELAGRKEMADKLREEYQLRKDAAALAGEAGISEQQALTALREKAKLLKQLKDKEENGGKLRGIRRYEGSVSSTLGARGRLGVDGSRIVLGGARLGLNARNSELRRRAGERSAAQRPPADPGLKALERSVDLQEQMLGVFKKLGVI